MCVQRLLAAGGALSPNRRSSWAIELLVLCLTIKTLYQIGPFCSGWTIHVHTYNKSEVKWWNCVWTVTWTATWYVVNTGLTRAGPSIQVIILCDPKAPLLLWHYRSCQIDALHQSCGQYIVNITGTNADIVLHYNSNSPTSHKRSCVKACLEELLPTAAMQRHAGWRKPTSIDSSRIMATLWIS